ncbi:MAG: ATP-binding protein [bacterium]
MKEKLKSEYEITGHVAKINIAANKNYIPAITGFIKIIAEKYNIKKEEGLKLELVIEEAALSIIEHSFVTDKEGYLDVEVQKLPGKLKISFFDKGMPYDFLSGIDDINNISGLLIKAYADEIRFNNLGKQGREIIIFKNLPGRELDKGLFEKEKTYADEIPIVDEKLTFQLMDPDQALDLTKCVYRIYGYNYPIESIYFPEERKELLENRLLEACVVINSKDEIVGHVSLKLNTPDAMIAEISEVLIDNRYLARDLFIQMKLYLLEYAKTLGLYGFLAKIEFGSKTLQQGFVFFDSVETGFLFGSSNNIFLGNILYYKKINQSPDLSIYPPLHHQSIIVKIYRQLDINRIVVMADLKSILLKLPQHTNLMVKIKPEIKTGIVTVIDYGNDFILKIRDLLDNLICNGVEFITIDLPLNNPITQVNCAILEAEGFFFAGIIPEFQSDGDILRLQYVKDEKIIQKIMPEISDFGKELLEYVYNSCLGGKV